jgi:hypothetical protein
MNYPADNPGIKKRWCKNAPALFGRTDRLLEEDFSPRLRMEASLGGNITLPLNIVYCRRREPQNT